MIIVGGLVFALGIAVFGLVVWLLERGVFAKLLGLCLLAVPVILFLNWQLPYWTGR